MAKLKHVCIECGNIFYDYYRKRAQRKFCSTECGYENKRKRVTIICEYCGKQVERKIYDVERRVDSRRFCSRKCAALFTANEVGQRFKGKAKPRKQREKMSTAALGKKNHNWKGGTKAEHIAIRKRIDYKDWRNDVFERDDYTCVRCLNRGGNLHAHHIIPFSIAPEERFEVSNGATLCKSCHQYIHAYELNGSVGGV